MSSMWRHKIANKYGSQLNAISGDEDDLLWGEGSSDAKSYSNLIATAAQAAGEIAETQMKKQEEAKKSAATKEAEMKRANEEKDAVAAAEKARAVATADANAARIAALKASAESQSYGPLHVAAQNAADKAAMSDAEARRLEAKAMTLRPFGAAGMVDYSQYGQKKSSGVPSWVWWALGGVGVVGVSLLAVKLMRGSSTRHHMVGR